MTEVLYSAVLVLWNAIKIIVSNPLLSTVRDGIALARAQQVDAILSVGGGSVLDSAKAIAAGVAHAGDVWELFTGQARIQAALPVFAILTLAATGSEMNCSAVVTNDETQEKFFITAPAIFPRLSIVNPRLMQSVSLYPTTGSSEDIHQANGIFTMTLEIGRSSIKMRVEVWSDELHSSEWRKVTEAMLVFVAIDSSGRTRPLPPRR